MTTQKQKALELALEGGGLYEITGRIEDIDKCIVHRHVIKEVLAVDNQQLTTEAQQSNEQVEPVVWAIGSHIEIDYVFDKETPLYTHPPVPTAQPDCTRSHPHEEMSKECELRTEIARLTNQQAHRSQAQLQLKMTALERAWFHGYENDIESAMHNLREEIINPALAQPEQDKERCVGCEACIDTACGRDECPKGWPKAAQPEQEPVAWMYPDALCDRSCLYVCTKAFTQFPECATTPPQRKPLTDEQIDSIADKFTVHTGEMWEPELCIEFNDSCKSVHSFAREIEAAHGIKGD